MAAAVHARMESPGGGKVDSGLVAVASGAPSSAAEKQDESNGSCLRADQINLADLDSASERHRNGTLNPAKQVCGQKEEWEVDIGKLELKHLIARGSFGSVYRGVFDGQDVAVKLLDWGAEEGLMGKDEVNYSRFALLKEVAAWHKLDHPNVAKFIGASMENSDLRIPSHNQGGLHFESNVCCVIVEYVTGGPLKDFLKRHHRRKLTFEVVMQLALDLSRGLSYVHSCSIVHRDVKTENILLDKKMKVKIADFGLARMEAQNPKDMTGETGTLRYMAPEVLDGKPYNRKCDVYSFGICLWETYCCDMPYPDLSFNEMISAIVRQNLRPKIPMCCPDSLSTIMKKCWDANPEKRPNMDEVVHMLEAIDTRKGGGMIATDGPRGCCCFATNRGP